MTIKELAENHKSKKQIVLAKHWLNKNQYLAELTTCLAIVTVDDNGNITRIATFGNKQ